jgi:DNA polymerase III delta subunit
LQKELRRWKETFLEKHGEANLSIHEGESIDWGRFSDEAKAAPFLSSKRLLMVEGLPPITKEQLAALLPEMHEHTILLISAPVLDKRKALAKALLYLATVNVFSPLPRAKLGLWILGLCHAQGAAIHPHDADYLIERVGTDQWHLRHELLKAIAYASPRNPSRGDIERVCLPSGTHAEWTLADLIGKGKLGAAASYHRALAESGEDAGYLWNAVFLTIIKNLVTLWIVRREKPLPHGALARETGIHPLSVQSLLPFAESLSLEGMRAIVRSVLAADRALKTGELRATATDPIELQCMLERQILALRS